jgi:hypothetical protein
MNRPPEIPQEIWDVLTVRVAAQALLLPPSFEIAIFAGDLCSVRFDEETPAARLLRLRCADEGGKFSKGMRCTMEKSIEKARKLLKLNKRKARVSDAQLRTRMGETDAAMDGVLAALEAAKTDGR